jgi:hypothetical protein
MVATRQRMFRALIALPLLVAGCMAPTENGGVEARRDYLAAKARCEARYRHSLVALSDCRTVAANRYIRPWYRYGDLMTWIQVRRRMLAEKVDRHEMSRATYNREIAKAERQVSREENRRNAALPRTPPEQHGLVIW